MLAPCSHLIFPDARRVHMHMPRHVTQLPTPKSETALP